MCKSISGAIITIFTFSVIWSYIVSSIIPNKVKSGYFEAAPEELENRNEFCS